MTDVPLYWAPPTNATSDTDYKVLSDVAASGTFVAVSGSPFNSTTPYAAVTTILSTAIDADDVSITGASLTSFADGDYIIIDREMILAGGKSSNTFASCTRGVGGSITQTHEAGVTIYKAHETQTITGVSFGSRHAIRYCIVRSETSGDSVAREIIAYSPTLPPTDNLTTIYGIWQDVQGNPQANVTVTLAISQGDNFHPSTGEVFYRDTETTTTDADGYFEFFIPRDIDRAGGDTFTLTIDPSNPTAVRAWTISSIPDVDTIHFLEVVD